MIWLLAKIWTSLAIAALLGVLIGWLTRGIGLKKRVLRAEMRLAEITKHRDELATQVDALQAQSARREDAPRPVQAVASVNGNGQALQVELAQRDQRLKALTDELARSKAELERLQHSAQQQENAKATAIAAAASLAIPTAAAAASSSAADPAPPADGQNLAAEFAALQKSREELVWRNRYLETRVGVLERAAEKANSLAGTNTAAPASDPGSEKEAFMRERDQLVEQVRALKERVATLESAPAPATSAAAPGRSAETDQELARLRWRNRYLESRLDYLEGRRETEQAATPQAASAPAAAEVIPPAVARPEPEPEPTPEAELAPPASSEPARLAEPVPAILPEEPLRLSAPRDPGPDRLTTIAGIGPLIEGALNRLGIFHYDQIASWTPSQAMWVSDALGFPGRVQQEGWGQQARSILMGSEISQVTS
jgi:predicted flap endonuclease-1-like 5' DNA nuclease